jgi:hypothetical protein
LHSHQQCESLHISLQPCQHLLLSFYSSHAGGCKVVSYFLMTHHAECLCTCFVTYIVEEFSDLSSTYYLGYLSFYCWVLSILYIFEIQVPYHICDLWVLSSLQWFVFSFSWW